MNVFVSGATGFLGSYVIRSLIDKGHRVVATSVHLEKALKQQWYENVDYFPFEIGKSNLSILASRIKGIDCCIHLAWDGLPNFNDPDHELNYLRNHYEFLREIIASGTPKITVTGTCLEYGLQEGSLSEHLPPFPVTSYGRGKDELRKLLEAQQTTTSFELDWIRLFYMYGEGQHSKSILPQLDAAINRGDKVFRMSKGDQQRDYLPVEKVAEIIVNLALRKQGCGIVNGCSGKPISIADLVQQKIDARMSKIIPEKGFYNYPDYEPFAFWGSVEKLHSILKK